MKAKVIPIDPSKYVFDINRNLEVVPRESRPGPPQRIDGMTVGIVAMDRAPPHNGEMHPDGDEILYVISGKLKVVSDSSETIFLGPGEACIVKKGEWHKVELVEKALLMHITPGPNGEHRPLREKHADST